VLTWPQLRRQVASLALHLQAQGVQPGDRVAAYLPNMPEAIVAFLASASIGAVWSICAPDMGVNAVLDRFRQIDADRADRLRRRDLRRARLQDRLAVVAQLRAALPSVRHLLMLDQLGTCPGPMPRCGTPAWRRRVRATMRRPGRSSRRGCRSTIRCGSSIPAARPACPNPSCMAMAARCW
jgi:acyl-coenzyme A synthetase/AMP-(fatty) acid ligase